MIFYNLHAAAKSCVFYVVFVLFHTNMQQIIVGGLITFLYII